LKNKVIPILFSLLILVGFTDALAFSRSELDKAFGEAVKSLRIPGGVMIIQGPSGKRWTVSAGTRKLGSKSPVTVNTRFRIGSITKTYVASLILMLVSEKLIELDTMVHNILPDVVGPDNLVTVRDLLGMRSNIGNFAVDKRFLREFRRKPRKKWKPAALLKYGVGGLGPAGTSFVYNNTNYILLGMIIEKLTGDSFNNQVRKRILNPLKLKNTYFPTTSIKIPTPFARGYDYNPATGKVTDLSLKINPSWAWCSGNAVSTASDVMDWLVAYLDGYGIDEQLLIEQMNLRPALHYGVFYGLGVMSKYDAVGHNGNFAGIYTALAFKFKGYYFVILTNGQSVGGMQDATAESVFWRVIGKTSFMNKKTATVKFLLKTENLIRIQVRTL